MSKRIIPAEQLSADTYELLEMLNSETDLPCVVVGAAFLDTALASLLSRRFRKSGVAEKLLAPSGALGSFAARSDLAYCLDLVGKDRCKDLGVIAEVRNLFAHGHLRLSFGDAEVRKLCERLNEWKTILTSKEEDTIEKVATDKLAMRARNQFKLSVVFLSNWLLLAALGI